MLPSDYVDRCDRCGGRTRFTGRTKLEGGRRWALLRCDECDVEGWQWDAPQVAALEAWERQLDGLDDREAFLTALAGLRSRDPRQVAAAMDIRPRPWLDADDYRAVSPELLDGLLRDDGFLPAPSDAGRADVAVRLALRIDLRDARALAGADPVHVAATLARLGRAPTWTTPSPVSTMPFDWTTTLQAPPADLVIEYRIGSPSAPDSPQGQSLLRIRADGEVRLEQNRRGLLRRWQGRTEAATVTSLCAALGRAGFPLVPPQSFVPGASIIDLSVRVGMEAPTVRFDYHWALKTPEWSTALGLLLGLEGEVSLGALRSTRATAVPMTGAVELR